MGVWGANEWTDNMFKKYWWVVALMIGGYIGFRIYTG